jgi:HAD superfamily phosphatase (TIGR01668 family)
VEAATGVTVLAHSTKKPGCGAEIMEYFRAHPETGVTRPEHVAVVGDRLTTDVMMANLAGSYALWVRDGVVPRGEIGVVSLWKFSSDFALRIFFGLFVLYVLRKAIFSNYNHDIVCST